MPASPAAYALEMTNANDWPTSGSVFTLLIEQAPDGVTWSTHCAATYDAAYAWPSNANALVASATGALGVFGDAVTTRTMRATITMLQACTLGFSLVSIPSGAVAP
jgi:hypothetical protein